MIGALCDMNRFEQAADLVEWEVFLTMILKARTGSRGYGRHSISAIRADVSTRCRRQSSLLRRRPRFA